MRKKLRVGIDIDDVVADCNLSAINCFNQENGTNFSVHDIEGWGDVGPTKGRMKYFSSVDFVRNQTVLPGAQDFVRAILNRGAEVFFITATPMRVVQARADWIRENFPEIPERNIILTARKDVCCVDVLIDDAPHNILTSPAKYPILFRKPWNKEVTGLPAANSYDDILNLIDTIIYQSGYEAAPVKPEIVCLVAPSGSGKTEVVERLRKNGHYDVPTIETTGSRKQNYYRQISLSEFNAKVAENEFAETTSYAGDYYGATKKAIHDVFDEGKRVVIPIDICGANALRRIYGKYVTTVYISRPKDELVAHILNKDLTNACKVNRILALDYEIRNEELCDVSTGTDMDTDAIVRMIENL